VPATSPVVAAAATLGGKPLKIDTTADITFLRRIGMFDYFPFAYLIGIGPAVTRRPLSHHPVYGFRTQLCPSCSRSESSSSITSFDSSGESGPPWAVPPDKKD
jgi:hypothetical protein